MHKAPVRPMLSRRKEALSADALHHRYCRACNCRRRSGASVSFTSPPGARDRRALDGRVNGRRVGFLIDTGASVVALTARDAARLGIHPSHNAFVAEVKTANGIVRAAPARLDMVEGGGLELRDVAALVLPEGGLRDNLLGLSLLSRLRRFEFSDGKLVLEQ